MSNLIAGLEPVGAPTARRSRGRLLVRTVKRRLCIKAKKALEDVVRMEQKEAARGAVEGYNPFTVSGLGNSANQKAWLKVVSRIEEALKARE